MTADEVAKRMARRQRMMERELQKAVKETAIGAIRYSKKKMTEDIYSIAIPIGKYRLGKPNKQGKRKRIYPGRKLWKRTGHLRRSEKYEIISPYQVNLVNTAVYAKRRHELGKPGKGNTERPAHWRDDVREIYSDQFLSAVYHEIVLDVLKATGG